MVPKAKRNIHQCEYHLQGMKKSKNVEEFEITYAAFFFMSARTVTFSLQKEFTNHPVFAEWYERKREHLRDDRIARFFVDERNRIEKEGINSLSFSLYINQFNSQNDLINKPNDSDVLISGNEIYYHINKGTGKEDIIPANTRGNIFTQIFFAPSELGNVLDTCEKYFSTLKSVVEEWTGILNESEAVNKK